ncbi:hypothetical protein BJX65DRAFT_321313 [Aspergillus insuetus]
MKTPMTALNRVLGNHPSRQVALISRLERHLKCDNESETCRTCQKTGDVCQRTLGTIRFRHGSSARYGFLFQKDQVWLHTGKTSSFDFVDEPDWVIASSTRDSASDGDDEHDAQAPDDHDETSRLEAILLRYFIQELSPWFDICDPDRHFARALPYRARDCPPLMQAILTASARHLTTSSKFKSTVGGYAWNGRRIVGLNHSTALHYHSHCISSLLSLSGDLSRINSEDLLAAAIVLRFYEEIDSPSEDNVDKGVLLRVLNIFVNAQLPSPEAFPRSLLEQHHLLSPDAASPHTPPAITPTWSATLLRACLSIAFRQELYKSFMTQRPFSLPLSRWSALRSFSPAGEGTWADRLVLFCANVLEFCYGSSETDHLPCTDVNRWNYLTGYADTLRNHLPPCFEPLYTRNAIKAPNGCHATAISHLYLAKMLLTVFDPTIPKLGHGHMAAMQKVQAVMRETVIKLCGIALSNRRASSVFVDATMGIEAGGECIVDLGERRAVLEVLRITEVEYAWPTGWIAERLRGAWGNNHHHGYFFY